MTEKTMSPENQDWISAAADNRTISQSQLDKLLQHTELQQQLQRYQLAGSILRQEKSCLSAQFDAEFARLLEQEQPYQLQTDKQFTQQVASFFRQAANSSWSKSFAQGAAAASVAILAVLGVQHYQGPADQELLSPLPVLQTNKPNSGYAPVSLSQVTADSRFEQQEQAVLETQKIRLLEMLHAHHQQIRVMEQVRHTPEQKTEKPDNNER